MKRTVIKINEALCNGCGACVKGCHEGALQLLNGKAVVVGDLYCDGLGACIGECPVGAIELEEREAEPYNEEAVMERMLPKGEQVILAHLNHLKEHGEQGLYQQGIDYLKKHNISELHQFPVQLHLLNPSAGFIHGANMLLAADCTAFASGEFHARFLKGKILAIACPKLDAKTEVYIEKLTAMIDQGGMDTLTVLIMEVPCCGGLLRIAQEARLKAERNIPLKKIVLSVRGEVMSEEWV